MSLPQTQRDLEPRPATPLHTVHQLFAQVAWVFFHPCLTLRAIGTFCHHVLDYVIKEGDYLGQIGGEAIVVTSTLFATHNAQLPSSPPGGLYTDTLITNNQIVHQSGKAVSAYNNPVQYRRLSVTNSITLTCNVIILVLYVTRIFIRRRIVSFLLLALILWSATSFGYGHIMSMDIITPDHNEFLQRGWDFENVWLNASLIAWLVIAGVLVVGLISKLLKL